jgi:hypothetical protein
VEMQLDNAQIEHSGDNLIINNETFGLCMSTFQHLY